MDSERPIEKALRAYARKRGEEAPARLELHPVNRRRLQAEVAERFGRPSRRGRGPFGSGGLVWPRLAWGLAGLGVVAVVAVGVWRGTRPARHPGYLAQNLTPTLARSSERVKPPPPGAGPVTRSAPMATPVPALGMAEPPAAPAAPLTLEDRPVDAFVRQPALASGPAPEAADRRFGSTSLAARGGQPAPQPVPAPPAVSDSLAVNSPVLAAAAPSGVAPNVAAAAPIATVAPSVAPALSLRSVAKPVESEKSAGRAAASTLAGSARARSDRAAMAAPAAKAAGLAGQATAARTSFARVEAKDKAAPLPSGQIASTGAVLTLFQMDRTGTEVRLTDRDGSVYVGILIPIDRAAVRSSTGLTPPADAKALAPPEPEPVSGAAVSLAPPSGLFSIQVSGTNRTSHLKVVFLGTLSQTNRPASLRGNVQVGSRVAVPIEAVEQKP